MKSFAPRVCVAFGLALAGAGTLKAQTLVAVPSLYNTGVAVSGELLPEGSGDSHYTLIAQAMGSTYGPTPSVAVTSQSPIGTGMWLGNGPSSQWLVPGPGASGAIMDGYYTYRTTFNLTGYDPLSAVVRMRVAADRNVVVYLNGTPTGLSSAQQGYYTLSDWSSISTGFQPGLNSFDFVVWNVGSEGAEPPGLRVEANGMAAPVPEPGGIVLIAVVGLGWLRLRKRRMCPRMSPCSEPAIASSC